MRFECGGVGRAERIARSVGAPIPPRDGAGDGPSQACHARRMTTERGFWPRALGEIAIRCADLPAMTAFYEDVLGLTRLAGDHRSGIAF